MTGALRSAEAADFRKKRLGTTEFFYGVDARSRIQVAESALLSMARDMDSRYETAGFLAGNVSTDGTLNFSRYLPQQGLTRLPEKLEYQEADVLEQLHNIRREGYDAVAFVHLHPPGTVIQAWSAEYVAREAYNSLYLNSVDAQYAEVDRVLAETAGFKEVHLGILVREEWRKYLADDTTRARKVAVLALYDTVDRSGRLESFALIEDGEALPRNAARLETMLRRRNDAELVAEIERSNYTHEYEYNPNVDMLPAVLERARRLIEQYEETNPQYKGYISAATDANAIRISVLSTPMTRSNGVDAQLRREAVNIANESLSNGLVGKWPSNTPGSFGSEMDWAFMRGL